ncbi:hypothetical protein D3C72_1634950 [compost metagenome]
MLAFQPLPGHAADAGHGLAHLVEHVGHAGVMPVQPELRRHLLDDPQVLARLPRRVQCLAAELDGAVGVGEGAGLLREGRSRQHHVGQVGGLGQEDVLHHQVVERGQRVARMLGVRV